MALKGRSAVIAYIKVLRPEDANRMTNSRCPDQTALSDLGLPGGYLLVTCYYHPVCVPNQTKNSLKRTIWNNNNKNAMPTKGLNTEKASVPYLWWSVLLQYDNVYGKGLIKVFAK